MQYFSAFCAGLTDAIRRYRGGVDIVVVSDGVPRQAVEEGLSKLAAGVPMMIAQANEESPSLIRREMLLAAAGRTTEAIVSFDMDDIPTDLSLSLHAESLECADFSFGDMLIIDESGEPNGRTFFGGASVPNAIDSPEALRERNFIGFTNSAVRSECVASTASKLPVGVDAADWWFFSKLLGVGYRGKQTSGPVVSYRTHGASLLGARSPESLDELRRQCEIILKHLEALGSKTCLANRKARIERLENSIDDEPDRVLSVLDAASGHGVWYERTFRIANELFAA